MKVALLVKASLGNVTTSSIAFICSCITQGSLGKEAHCCMLLAFLMTKCFLCKHKLIKVHLYCKCLLWNTCSNYRGFECHGFLGQSVNIFDCFFISSKIDKPGNGIVACYRHYRWQNISNIIQPFKVHLKCQYLLCKYLQQW